MEHQALLPVPRETSAVFSVPITYAWNDMAAHDQTSGVRGCRVLGHMFSLPYDLKRLFNEGDISTKFYRMETPGYGNAQTTQVCIYYSEAVF